MFWRKKKALANQVKDQTDAIVADLASKWTVFCKTLHFKEGVPLSTRIEAFSMPAFHGIVQKYPIMKSAPPELLWMMILTAVQKAGTHSQDDINKSVKELEAKYAHG